MAIKSVLITGCSTGGIGGALALAFQKRGLHVFATARTLSKMSHLEKLPNVTLLTLDVTSSSSIATAVEAVEAQTGGTLDYLVNNSGGGLIMPTLDTDIEEAKRMFDVNLWGVLAVTQAFAPLVIAAKGSIVNGSSLASCLNPPWTSLCAASKAALTSMSDSMRLELVPFDVKVVTVMTGAVKSNFFINSAVFKLPSTSPYMPLEKKIAPLAEGRVPDDKLKMDPHKYAERVVSDVVGGAKGKIWRGRLATCTWLVSIFLPGFILDFIQSRVGGLDNSVKIVHAHKE